MTPPRKPAIRSGPVARFQTSRELMAAIDALAERKRRTRTSVIIEALERYLEQEAEKAAG